MPTAMEVEKHANWYDNDEAANKGINQRVLTQVWDSDSVDLLASGLVALTKTGEGIQEAPFATRVNSLLHFIDLLQCNAEAASAVVVASALEQKELRGRCTKLNEDTELARKSVQSLRELLARERISMERMMRYDSLAKIVAQEPSTQESEALIRSIHAEIETLKKEEQLLARKKQVAGNEFSLLMQCVNDMQLFATELVSTKDEPTPAQSHSAQGNPSSIKLKQGNETRPDPPSKDDVAMAT